MSADPEFIDVVYRGLRVAHKVKLVDGFIELETPLPVGTSISVECEGKPARAARVAHVVEHEAAAKSPPGMRLTWVAAEESPAESAADTTGDSHDEQSDAGGEPGSNGAGGGNGAPEPGGRKKRGKKKR